MATFNNNTVKSKTKRTAPIGTTKSTAPFSDRGVKALKPKSTDYRKSDYPSTGLQIAVRVSGSKKWVFSYTSPITKKRLLWAFASYPAVSLSEARAQVVKFRQLINEGIDPRNQDKKKKAEATRNSSLGTVKNLFALYVEDMKLDNKTSFGDVESKFKNHIENLNSKIILKNT